MCEKMKNNYRMSNQMNSTVVRVLTSSMERFSERTAMVDIESSVTYKELKHDSDVLTQYIEDVTRGENSFVLLMLPRRVCFFTAAIAVQKAGCAYVPISHTYPAERINYIISDCQPKLIITTSEIFHQRNQKGELNIGNAHLLFLDKTDLKSVDASPADLSSPDIPALLLYTSGTTGKPKGVLHSSHSLLCASLIWKLELGEDAPWLATAVMADFSFIASTFDTFGPLYYGGCVHILGEDVRADMDYVRKYIHDNHIYRMFMPSAFGVAMINTYELELKQLILGGEKVSGINPEKLTGDVEIFDGYGMSESLAIVPHLIKPYEDIIPIGIPFKDVTVYIIDENGKQVQPGEKGELCLCSDDRLFMEYFHLPELTAERLVDCPFNPGHKMFHTGDMVTQNNQGELVYCSRMDNMIKLHGFRIEAGEIESVVAQYEGIIDNVCILRKINGEDALCCYYTANKVIDKEKLIASLEKKLTSYMVPSFYMMMDAFPRNANGKIDRKKLPEPDMDDGEIVAPATEMEEKISQIISKILESNHFGVTTNLIKIGMGSLSAMRLSADLHENLGISISPKEILASPTVRKMASAATDSVENEEKVWERRAYYPLSENQRLVYLEWDKNRGTTQYNISTVLKSTKMNAERLRGAVVKVLQAHPYMNTVMAIKDGDIMQKRIDDVPAEIEIRRLVDEPVQAYFQEFVRPFNLLSGPLYRIKIFQSPSAVYLFLDFHHVISDGLSINLFMKELQAAYSGGDLAMEKYTYFDHTLDEYAMTGSKRYQEAEDYFDHLLSGVQVTSYPLSTEGTTKDAYDSATTKIKGEEINFFCHENGFTQGNYFLTAFLHVLHSMTFEDSVMITTINNGRNDYRAMNTMGMFVKTLPVVSTMDTSMAASINMVQAVESMQKQFQSTQSYDFYPFIKMGERHHVHAQIMFEYQVGIGSTGSDDLTLMPLAANKVLIPLVVSVMNPDDEGNYTLLVRYAPSLYSREDMESLLLMVKTVSEKAVTSPTMASIPLQDGNRISQVISLSAGPALDMDISKTFANLFTECAHKYGSHIAVNDDGGEHTYQQLENASNVLAHRLIDAGVEPESFVCLMLERTWFFPMAIIATHKAGAAYTPLDIDYPVDRIQYMLENSESKVLFTTHDVYEHKCKEEGLVVNEDLINVMYLDDIDFTQEEEPIDLSRPEGAAYMIYTSGSTGKPKGVVLHQAGLRNFIACIVKIYGLTSSDRISSHRAFSFVAHVEDIYSILTVGGSLHIMPSRIRKDLQAVYQFLIDHKITGCGFTTSISMLLINTYDLPVRYITAGGEKLTGVVSGKTQVINVYGPTECTDHTSVYKLDAGRKYDNIPVGPTLPNNWCFVVSSTGQLLPRGVAGELCFAGIQVGRGYWRLPEKTKEVFVDCPFIRSDRWGRKVHMYHTGDLVRWNKEGVLEYFGRMDGQVKIRGFRVELGEIENVALGLKGIKIAAAKILDISGNKSICLYYTLSESMTLDESIIREHIEKSSLADYMHPNYYIQLEEMPRLPNSKINRKALPMPEIQTEDIVEPETDRERQLFEVTSKILGHSQFGVTSNLISVGMSSLAAMRLSVAIHQQLNLVVETNDILTSPTLRELAKKAKDINPEDEHVWEKREYYPITENQRGIYIDWEMNRDTTQYNIPYAQKMPGVEATVLRDALIKVVNAHPYLKMRFEMREGDIVQRRNDEEPAAVDLVSMDVEPDVNFFQSRVKPFNLQTDRLYRIEIYRSPASVYLFTDFHHTIFDGLSSTVFLNDLQKACKGESLEAETYSSFEHALDEGLLMQKDIFKDAECYFDNLLDGAEGTPYPHSPDIESNGTAESGTVSIEITESAIRSFCRANDLTENSYFLTVLMQVLHRVTREEQILITSINNGRSDSRLVHAIGMYVKTLPVVSKMNFEKDGDMSVAQVAGILQKQFRQTQSFDFYPFTRMVERHHLHSEIMYVYQGGLLESLTDMNKENVLRLRQNTVKFPLNVACYSFGGDRYGVLLEYDTSLYSHGDMEKLASMLKAVAENYPNKSFVRDISLTDINTQKNLLTLSEGEVLDYDCNETFVDVFLRQVELNPEAKAVVDENSSISYGELDRRSDMLAAKLQKLGVNKDNFVCLMLPRCLEFEVSILGVFKSGGAYVPLDSDYPNERLLYMLENSESKVLITTHALYEEKQKMGDFHVDNVLFVDDVDWSERTVAVNHAHPEALAYMIYTSGSTGKPKGVMVEHHSLRSFVEWRVRKLNLNSADRNIEHASFSFDASLDDLICPLAAGAQVHIIPSSMRQNMDGIYHYICDYGITGMSVSTPLGMEMLNTYDLPLRYIAMGGEKLKKTKPSSVKVVNEYGPTEFTVCSSFHAVDSHRELKNIPIGRPVPNSSSFIADLYGNLLPQGVAGELCLMGTQMARGYWKREDLTQKAFTPCPFIPGRSMYHTGDLARWNENGELTYLGRIDNQVKLRGFRIEMGEIESCAMAFSEGIKSVAAGVKEINGTQHLCLFYVSEEEIDEDSLKSHMAATLTEYMVPDVFMRLDVMPMTPNGKIDRKGLPVPVLARNEYVEPATELERYFCDTFARILKLEKVGATDHFFQIGGSSLIAMRAVAAFVKDGYRIVYAELFNHPTPRSLAALIDDQNANKDDVESDWAVELESYDYSKIDQVLKDNNLGIYQKCKEEKQSLSTVLLTGATGYLGIHVLHELLHDESVSRIYCIIRDNKQLSGSSRLRTLLFYYFDKTYEEQFGKRLIIINGDLTDAKSFDEVERQMKGITSSITVINCAANVKHFSAGTDIEDVNIGGVKNCISFCLHSGARLIHTSTGSICGGFISETHVIQRQLKENELYFGQVLGSKYTYSKFIAERMVLEAIATRGLNGKIMRLGNLSARSTDGEFQINFHTNSFVGRLKAYQMLQCMPYSLVDMQVEFSPINEVARAIILLSSTPRECTVFQPMNIHSQLFGDVLGCLRHIGYNIRNVEDDEFKKVVTAALENTKKASILQSLLAYNVNKSKGKNVVFNVTDSEYTAQVLYRLGFSWSITTWDYIENFEKILKEMGLFDDDYTR